MKNTIFVNKQKNTMENTLNNVLIIYIIFKKKYPYIIKI